jgi:hypothetical protein
MLKYDRSLHSLSGTVFLNGFFSAAGKGLRKFSKTQPFSYVQIISFFPGGGEIYSRLRHHGEDICI